MRRPRHGARAPRGGRCAPLGAALVALAVAAAPAAGHISVLPDSAVRGEAREFTVRVPNERDVPTTAVGVDFPDGITVFAFADPPGGWTAEPVRAADGTFSGVEYTGGRIPVSGYVDFTVLGTPFEKGTAAFPARQAYADGRVKPWTGPPEEPDAPSPETGPTEPGPAAAVEVTVAGATAEEAPAVAPATGSTDDGSGAAVWLGIIAIAVSALALLGVGLLWSTRPARLPADD